MARLMFVLVVLTGAAGCTESPGWSAVSTEAHPEAVATAKAATTELFSRLFARLQGAVEEVGLAAAIDVCRLEAPAIAKAVSEERDLRVGRTSHRLRNPANAPPEWVADLEAKEPRIYVHSDGRTGVTLPIVAKALCTKCHGAADEIPPEVGEALAQAYPEDDARGFAPGDLRGQFWVEIPLRR
jgi:hypothetical protein